MCQPNRYKLKSSAPVINQYQGSIKELLEEGYRFLWYDTITQKGSLMQRTSKLSRNNLGIANLGSDEYQKGRKAYNRARCVEITSRGGQCIYAMANMDESGDYDDVMSEWTVNVLRKNHPAACPLENLSNLEVKIGNGSVYLSSFLHERDRVTVRVYSVLCQEEKSFSLTIGNEMVILGRCRGWPEARSPEEMDQAEDFNGTLENLLLFLESESLSGVELMFGCIVMKNFILQSSRSLDKESVSSSDSQLQPSNWETFS